MQRKEARSIYGTMLENLVKKVNDGAKYKDVMGEIAVLDKLDEYYKQPIEEARAKAHITVINHKYGTNISIED